MAARASTDPEAAALLRDGGRAPEHAAENGADAPARQAQAEDAWPRRSAVAAVLAGLLAVGALAAFALSAHGGARGQGGLGAGGLGSDVAVARQSLDVAPGSGAAETFVKLVQTARDSGDKLAEMPDVSMVPDFNFDGPTILIDSSFVDQELVGFGGAFTEASAVTFKNLRTDLQEQFIEHYFGASGLRYTMGRVHINSCDFSVSSYSFDDQEGDYNLESFDDGLTHDTSALIPLIKRAKLKVDEAAQAHGGSGLQLRVRADGQTVGDAETIALVKEDGGSSRGYFFLKTASGGYITTELDGSLSIAKGRADGDRSRFKIVENDGGSVSLQASSGLYVSAFPDGSLRAQGQVVDAWEKFGRTSVGGDAIALRSTHGGYVAEKRPQQGLRLLATPWSPPAWMKNSGKMDGSSAPCLKKECKATWAQYVARWISAYEDQGLPIWALSVQNEPTNNPAWEGCLFTPEEEAEFLGEHLGPTIKEKHPDVAIFVYDDSKHLLPVYVDTALKHPKAKQYVQGAAFHWYTGDLFDRVSQVHKSSPQVMLLASEATYERRMWLPNMTQAYSDWRFGEGYAHDIIGDLNAGAVGWIDWNLLLDMKGGPNHVGNVCDAAVVADCQAQRIHVHPQSYYVGHFSRFIPPGSKRVGASVQSSAASYRTSTPPGPYGTCTGQLGLETTAFRRADGWIVVVVLNCAAERIDFKLRHGSGAVKASIPAHAIQTYSIPPA